MAFKRVAYEKLSILDTSSTANIAQKLALVETYDKKLDRFSKCLADNSTMARSFLMILYAFESYNRALIIPHRYAHKG